MSLSATCPSCGKTLKAKDDLAGKRVRCPGCRDVLTLPAAEPAALDFRFEQALTPPTKSATVDSFQPPASHDDEFPDLSEFSGSQATASADDEELLELPAVRKPIKVKRTEAADDDSPVMRVGRVAKSSSSSDEPPKKKTNRLVKFGIHWVFAALLVPLAISIFMSEPSFEERLAETLKQHPEQLDKVHDDMSKEEFFQLLPEGRLAGAHLAHDSPFHWLYALMALLAYWGMLSILWREKTAGPMWLLMIGVFTGTAGIIVLFLFQFAAAIATAGVRGRSILFLLLWIVGMSYALSSDPDANIVLSFLGYTCGVGFCEELCKALPLVYYFRNVDRTNWKGACLVGLATGIGFGISEGIHYCGDSYNGVAPMLTYFVRFFSCVALHAVWSSGVAMLMYSNQDYVDFDDWEGFAYFVKEYLIIAMILHGLYDTLLQKDLPFVALGIAIGSYFWWLSVMRRVGAPRKKRRLAEA